MNTSYKTFLIAGMLGFLTVSGVQAQEPHSKSEQRLSEKEANPSYAHVKLEETRKIMRNPTRNHYSGR